MEYSELPALPSAQSSQETTPQWHVPSSECMQQQHPIPDYGMPPSRPTFPPIDLQSFSHQSGFVVPTFSRDPISHSPLLSLQIPTQSSASELISHDDAANPKVRQSDNRHLSLLKNDPQSKPFSDDQSASLNRDVKVTVTCSKEHEHPEVSILSNSSPSALTESDIRQNPRKATTSKKILVGFNINDGNRSLSPNSVCGSKSNPSDKPATTTKEICNYDKLNCSSKSIVGENAHKMKETPVTETNPDNKAIIGYWCPRSPSTEKPSRSKHESSKIQDDTSNFIIKRRQSTSETTIDDEQNLKDGMKSSPRPSPLNDNNQFEIPPLPALKIRPFKRGPFKSVLTTEEPGQTSKQPSEITKESLSTDFLPFVKQEPKESPTSGSKITEIINICEKHVFGQTSSIQTILNICSQATGFPGCDRFCSQIITICNQLLSETYQNSHSIIDLCKNLTHLDLTGGKNKKDRVRQAKEPTNTSKQTTYTEPDFEDDVSDFEEREDTKDEDFDWKDILQNSDSEDGLNQEDDPDWSAYWEKKQETRSRRSDAKTKETKPIETKVKETKPKRIKIKAPKLEEKINDQEENVDVIKDEDEEKEESAFEEFLSENEELAEPKKKKKRSRGKSSKAEPKTKTKIPNVKGEFKCSECSKTFLTQRGYAKHENHHRNGFRITCEVCGVACPSPSHFKSHMRTHTGEKPYVCEVCGNSYAQMSTLKGHMLLHSDERPAQCEYCEYNCKSEKRLRRHMIVHTSEKKFQCEDCGARFLRSASLKKHLQIHKDVWPFLCELCPKKFKSKVHLRRHEEVHRDEYKYQCPVCGKRIRQAGNLKTHMRTHNGEKPYKCESCGKGFAHNVTRKQHQEQCRGNVEVLIQPPTENDYTKYNSALCMVGLKSLAHLS